MMKFNFFYEIIDICKTSELKVSSSIHRKLVIDKKFNSDCVFLPKYDLKNSILS